MSLSVSGRCTSAGLSTLPLLSLPCLPTHLSPRPMYRPTGGRLFPLRLVSDNGGTALPPSCRRDHNSRPCLWLLRTTLCCGRQARPYCAV